MTKIQIETLLSIEIDEGLVIFTTLSENIENVENLTTPQMLYTCISVSSYMF